MRITVLGGAGNMGSTVTRTLAKRNTYEITVAASRYTAAWARALMPHPSPLSYRA